VEPAAKGLHQVALPGAPADQFWVLSFSFGF